MSGIFLCLPTINILEAGGLMKEIALQDSIIKYKIYIDSTIDKFHEILAENRIRNIDRFFIITDDILYVFYKSNIEALKKRYDCYVHVIKAGEKSKNYNTILEIYDFLIKNNADKNSILIAFGGGVVGDLSAFAAATYMRGIRYINLPTTLISQVDSCIGGKNGFNYGGIKNIIGSFYDPEFVYISVNFLKSLSREHFTNGLAEVIKYGLIGDKGLLMFLSKNSKQIMEKENDKLLHIIKECLRIKSNVIKEDYKDIGKRNVLNFGHTIGHGIEIYSNYKILHGEAVALGILSALKLSEKKLMLSEDIFNDIKKLYKIMGLPINYKVDNYATFLYAIKHNKINSEGIRFVLLEDIGKCKIKIPVTENEVIWAIKESIDGGI